MVGMYVAYWLGTLAGVDPYIGMFGSMAFLFIMGWHMQKFLLNKIMDAPHYNQFILTMGVALFLENIALFFWPDYRQLKVSYQNVGIPIREGLQIELVRVLAFFISMILSIAFYYFLKLTDTGKAIRAVSQNTIGAMVVGINVRKIYMLTFAIGASLAGAAGAVITPFFPTFYNIGDMFILVCFVVVCLGGMGSLVGALIGGLMIGLAESLGTLIIPGGQKQIITFGLFILVMLFRPHGLFRYGGYWEAQG
jgi:branched-chain amino acid transport system permease protein